MRLRSASSALWLILIGICLLLTWGCGGGGQKSDTQGAAIAAGSDAASGAAAGQSGNVAQRQTPPAASGEATGTGTADTQAAQSTPGANDVQQGATDTQAGDTATAPGDQDENEGDSDTDAEDADEDFGRGWPLFGSIVSIEQDVMTLSPEIPDFIKQHWPAAAGDNPMPQLPDQVSVMLTTDTVFKQGGEIQDSDPFVVADDVVVWLMTSPDYDKPLARVVMDLASFEANWGAAHGGQQGTDGEPPGGPRWLMPVYGAITELNDASLTVAPQMPGMFRDHAQGQGTPPNSAPDTLTYMIDDQTAFKVDGLPADKSEFAVGDIVLVTPREPAEGMPPSDTLVAAVVSKGPMFGKQFYPGGAPPKGDEGDHSREEFGQSQGAGNGQSGGTPPTGGV